jgi:hypothetical protein
MKEKNTIIDIDWAAGTATIALTQGKTTLIDLEDLQKVLAHRWCAWFNPTSGRWYAKASVAGQMVYLHRWLIGTPRGLLTDHADLDGLNNVRSNIRMCTSGQNQANRGLFKNNTTGRKGVTLRDSGSYCSRLTIGRKSISLGTFKTAEMAGAAYDKAASTLFGSFARLNATEALMTQAA